MATTEDLITKANAMVAQTKAEGSTPFAGSSYATAPTNVGNINTNVTDTKIGTPATETPNVDSANAYNEASKTSTQAYIEQFQKDQLAREEARKAESKSFLDKMFASQKDATTIASEAESTQKLDEKFIKQQEQEVKISTLTKSYNELKNEVQKQKDALYGQGRGIVSHFLDNQAAQIDRNAQYKFNSLATEINFETAMLSIFKEDYNNAQEKADKAVQYALADQRSDLEMYKTFYDDNQQSFENVEKIYSDTFKNLIQVKEEELKTAEANKTYAMDNALKYNSMGAGITVNDSPEVVTQKIAKVGGELGYYAKQQSIQKQYSADPGGDTPTSIGFNDIMQTVINQGGTPEQAAREAAMVSENQGIQVDQKTLNSWTAEAKKMKKSVVETPTVSNQTTTPVSAKKAGQSTANFLQTNPYYQAFAPDNLYQGTKDVAGGVKSFFSGLFGY